MNIKTKETASSVHATKLIEDFFSNLAIGMFEGPRSNSGYNEYSDNMYYTKDTNKHATRYAFGEWVLQTEDMYGWDWRVTIDIMINVSATSLILRRIDCLGNATDILIVDEAKLANMSSIDEVITMLFLQGAHTDHLADLTDRGFSESVPSDTSDNESPWTELNSASERILAVAAITNSCPENNYGVQTGGITKSFSTDDGYVNKFWLSTTVDQTYLSIWGMGYTFTLASDTRITLDQVDETFKYFFTVIQSDLLSATPVNRNMAKIYQNNLIVLGGLNAACGYIEQEKEMTTLFEKLVDYMKSIAKSQPDKIRFRRNRVGDITGAFYYPQLVGESKPLRLWLTTKKLQHTPMNPRYIGTACLGIESSHSPSDSFTLFHNDLQSATGVVDILEIIRRQFGKGDSDADMTLIDEMLNRPMIH